MLQVLAPAAPTLYAPLIPAPPQRIFVILRAKHLRVDFDIPFAPDAALNRRCRGSRGDGTTTWPDDKQVAGTSFGVCHFDFSYFLEQKFIAAFSI